MQHSQPSTATMSDDVRQQMRLFVTLMLPNQQVSSEDILQLSDSELMDLVSSLMEDTSFNQAIYDLATQGTETWDNNNSIPGGSCVENDGKKVPAGGIYGMENRELLDFAGDGESEFPGGMECHNNLVVQQTPLLPLHVEQLQFEDDETFADAEASKSTMDAHEFGFYDFAVKEWHPADTVKEWHPADTVKEWHPIDTVAETHASALQQATGEKVAMEYGLIPGNDGMVDVAESKFPLEGFPNMVTGEERLQEDISEDRTPCSSVEPSGNRKKKEKKGKLTGVDKKSRRQEQNRRAARRCRDRKKQEEEKLLEKQQILLDEQKKLKEIVERLKRSVDVHNIALRLHLSSSTCRLQHQ